MRRWRRLVYRGPFDRRKVQRLPGPLTMLGDRVRLIDNDGEKEPGSMGTVYAVDMSGALHVRWDDGTQLNLLPDDQWEVIPTPSEEIP